MRGSASDKPSVVFYNRVYPPGRGATGRLLRDLARAFVRDGWDVTIVATGAQGGKDRDGAIRIIRVPAPARPRSVLSYIWAWGQMFLRGLLLPAPNLIVTMTDPPLLAVAGRRLARIKRCAHMHWCQDLYPDLLPVLGVHLPEKLFEYLKKISRRAMKDCDRVVVVGRCMARHLAHSGMDAQRLAMIPNWPDVELTAGARRARESAPEPIALTALNQSKPFAELFRDADPKFRVLYSGNIGRAHPVGPILEAAVLLAETHPEIEFVFVGDGPGFDRLAQERSKRGIHNMRFLPWQPASRLRELMESGDLHLITMEEGALGMMAPSKLYSALAVGRPCIFMGPPQCETARIINDFRAGSIVRSGDAQSLADAISAYRMNSDLWFAAHEGAAKAGKLFTPEESIRAWIERAREVARVPHRPVRRKAA